jgi:hypothetical protein
METCLPAFWEIKLKSRVCQQDQAALHTTIPRAEMSLVHEMGLRNPKAESSLQILFVPPCVVYIHLFLISLICNGIKEDDVIIATIIILAIMMKIMNCAGMPV